ncbi:MAG TPA: YqiJ family protein [Arenimonas sp.]|uniref:YqiJ family protein n=1 Tax=Arenimonas sp. TaxID=1872635 RepID=UPI002D7EE09B|nr:YqiJ family protein [Arenimonas sp.]HEU0153937.1 YqiJ family protein [Arenimonas sp.]
MLDFITAGANLPFTLALAMMLVLATLELLGLLFGLSASGFLDGWFDFDHGEVDGSELVTVSLVDKFMGWLHFGKVPVLILLAVFLVSFGMAGYVLQGTLWAFTGWLLPWWIAAPAVLPVTLPCIRVFGGVLARVLPKDETQSVSQSGLVGRMATIVLGTASQGSPAQAKVRDQHGQTHYVMLEPDEDGARFQAGDSVLLISHQGAVYRAIRDNNPALHS